MTPDMRLEWTPLSDALAHERNPKKHDDALIRASVLRFGFNDPLAINEATGKLLEGHGRLEALSAMKASGDDPPTRVRVRETDGEWLVPVVRGVSFEDEAEAEAYMVAHNRASESGGWVDTLLGQMLKDFDADDSALWESIGFTPGQADELLRLGDLEEETVGRDKNVAEMLETYLEGTIKQIVLYVTAEEYEPMLTGLQNVMSDQGLETHTHALMYLLKEYEAARR